MGQGELVTLEAMLSVMRSDELDARATRAQRHLGGKVAVGGFESILIGTVSISRECARLCMSLLSGERQSEVTEFPNANSEFAFWNFVADFRICLFYCVLRNLSILSTGYARRDSLTTPHIVVYTVICVSIGRSVHKLVGGFTRWPSYSASARPGRPPRPLEADGLRGIHSGAAAPAGRGGAREEAGARRAGIGEARRAASARASQGSSS